MNLGNNQEAIADFQKFIPISVNIQYRQQARKLIAELQE